MDELELVRRIRSKAGSSKQLVLGIGDDCAIFRPHAGEDLLFTSDQMIEGVHFRSDAAAADVGHRALARSLSDIAAMGGEPRFCLVSLSIPRARTARGSTWIQKFYSGLMSLARRTKTALAGGDLAHASSIYCDVTVCGAVPRGKALRRDGARAGDAIYVSGRLGKPWDCRIQPRLALGRSLRGRATSCMDLSDGLSLDLHRLCEESGVAAEIDHVPVSKGSTIERALHGGEDYELLFTLPSGSRAPQGTTRIGTIVRVSKGKVRFQGKPLALAGYNHFLPKTK